MSILAKPPKLYYYLVVLAVFVVILGGAGFYFYQKQNIQNPDSIQTPQNSLTPNPEPTKTANEANNKPKEESLISASFDADPNTDVIVFKECGISLKVEKTDGLYVFKKQNELILGVKNKTWNEILKCGDTDFKSKKPLKDSQEYLKWLKNLISESEIYQNPPKWSNMPSYYFKYDKLYYVFSRTEDSPNKSIISSLKFGTDTTSNAKVIAPLDILNLLKKPVPSVEEYNKKPQSSKDVFLLDCSSYGKILNPSYLSIYTNENKCIVTDENWNPLFKLDFSQASILGKNILNENVKYILSEDDYSITGDDVVCSQIIEVYKFDFKSGLVLKVKTKQPIIFNQCVGFNLKPEILISEEAFLSLDINCDPSMGLEKFIPLDFKCFKKDTDYLTYIKAYNDEQAKNKAAEAELGKYAELAK